MRRKEGWRERGGGGGGGGEERDRQIDDRQTDRHGETKGKSEKTISISPGNFLQPVLSAYTGKGPDCNTEFRLHSQFPSFLCQRFLVRFPLQFSAQTC